MDQLMGSVIAAYGESTASADVVVVEGLLPTGGDAYLGVVNNELIKTLNAQVILVASASRQNDRSPGGSNRVCRKCIWRVGKDPRVIINRYPVDKSANGKI